jgi:hypothetical protein
MPISRLSVLTVLFPIGRSLCIHHDYLFTMIALMVALSPCYMRTAGSCGSCSLEVGISRNFLLSVTQPGEGLCSVATQSNSPRHSKSVSQSINQSIVYLSQIIQEAVSASTRCFTVCSLYIQFYKQCYLTTNPSVYQTDWPASISNGQTVQHFPIIYRSFLSKWETTVLHWAFRFNSCLATTAGA